MLTVSGLVAIPKTGDIKEIELKNGSYILVFKVASQDPLKKGIYHRYPISVWVPREKIKEVAKEITPGSVFYIIKGDWAMKETGKSKFPYPELQVKYNEFKKLNKELI